VVVIGVVVENKGMIWRRGEVWCVVCRGLRCRRKMDCLEVVEEIGGWRMRGWKREIV